MVTNNDIRNYLGLHSSNTSRYIKQVDSINMYRTQTLMFISKPDFDLSTLEDTCTSCTVLVEEKYYPDMEYRNNDIIRVRNPKFYFALIVEKFGLKSKLQIESVANIVDSLKYMKEYPTIACYECLIGHNCHFDPGTIIGGTDFSPVMGSDRGELIPFPQLGGISIGNNVVVKYNSMIGKGTFGYTYIGDNTMIDYGCQIGHNCFIGDSCIIAAGTIIGGSTIIGDNTTIGIGAKIRNGLRIGNNVSIGMGAIVIKDVPDNCVVVGNPARIIEHRTIFDEEGLI